LVWTKDDGCIMGWLVKRVGTYRWAERRAGLSTRDRDQRDEVAEVRRDG
jgi:hypothetical protein